VSRVINQRPDISPETRTRVQNPIERLNYQPSALARSLIRQRSLTLGVVTAGLNFIGPSRTLSGNHQFHTDGQRNHWSTVSLDINQAATRAALLKHDLY
jgi:hypothetical protein